MEKLAQVKTGARQLTAVNQLIRLSVFSILDRAQQESKNFSRAPNLEYNTEKKRKIEIRAFEDPSCI